ncbi:MAG: hypothetical protein GEU74_00660 [Nitriliruptorales bacterium]|nr:hypothetical protein [Nitriliruptorales bacterium]
MTGNQQLRAQLDTMRESLRAFEDPIVEEIPGLRLMHETLRERERHIAEQIRRNETVSLEVIVHGAAADRQAVPASLAALVLTTLRDAVMAAALHLASQWEVTPADDVIAAAVEPHVETCAVDGGDATLRLTRPPGELSVQLGDTATRATLAELAFLTVLQTLQRGATGDAIGEQVTSVTEALRPLAEALVSLPLSLDLAMDPHVVEPLTVKWDRNGAQRLLGGDTTA